MRNIIGIANPNVKKNKIKQYAVAKLPRFYFASAIMAGAIISKKLSITIIEINNI